MSTTNSNTQYPTTEAVNSLSIEIHNKLCISTDNSLNQKFIFSPYSIISLLSLLYMGSSGETRKTMRDEFSLSTKKQTLVDLTYLKSIFKSIDQCNIVLVRDDAYSNLDSEYVDKISSIGSIEKFSSKKLQKTVDKINQIVSSTTKNLITNILSIDDINVDTICILLNCLYFNLKWDIPFKKNNTKNESFYENSTKTNKTKTVEMMCLKDETFKYTENESFQLVEMNYLKNEFTFGVILPKKSKVEMLSYKQLQNLISKLKKREIATLKIPKFTQESTFNLMNILDEYNLNFNEMNHMFDNSYILKVSKFIHKAIIIVEEEGTKAAAATDMYIAECEDPDINFIANHPFSYYIRHISTNTIIFHGKYQ